MENDEVGQGLGPCFTWQAIKAYPWKKGIDYSFSPPACLILFTYFRPILIKKLTRHKK